MDVLPMAFKTNWEISDINRYIESKFFKCELNWYGASDL